MLCTKRKYHQKRKSRQWKHTSEDNSTAYNDKRFYRLTQLVGLKAVIRRVRPAYQRSTPEITAENVLGRNFTAEKPDEKWLTDVTEMKYGNGGKLYLSARDNPKFCVNSKQGRRTEQKYFFGGSGVVGAALSTA